MQNKNLLIVFVKNAVLGHAKTRLAASIGDHSAFEVYKHLITITERETISLNDSDIHVYFSSEITDELWKGQQKFVQQGADLGARMQDAFQRGFDQGYERIIGVGSDLPDLNAEVMTKGLNALTTNEAVFGPSEDGGYYLIGMSRLISCIFENKPWSTETLLNETVNELHSKNVEVATLKELNDIDTLEDLQASSIADKFSHLWEPTS